MPEAAKALIGLLEGGGHAAYAVGGCVRDSLLGIEPHDWDITTSATPEQMKACFAGLRVVETGIRHGTLTVLMDGVPIEVTCFRADGDYKDHRRPDSVKFVDRLEDDLSRRDFTINAMALSKDGELIDRFGGREDLEGRLIRCVGDPEARFEEDALRILRALRFASTYEFEIEQHTARAMRAKRRLLRFVSAERVYEELKRALCGAGAMRMLCAFPDVLGELIPDILPAIGCPQHNPHHDADVWMHTARAVGAIEPEPALRLTMLLHDLGKPHCFTMDPEGVGHFLGHARISEALADKALEDLRADSATRERVSRLIKLHDMRAEPEPKWIKRRLNQLGQRGLSDLLKVQRADAEAQSPFMRARKLAILDECEAILQDVLAQDACFSLRQLAVNGSDLIALGIPAGAPIGASLESLLRQVIDGRLPNERETLLHYAKRFRPQEGPNIGTT